MAELTRRQLIRLTAAASSLTLVKGLQVCTGTTSQSSSAKLQHLTLAGSPINITILLAHLVEQERLKALVPEVSFKAWKTQDQLRADVITGNFQVSATPTHVAANLYWRGVPIKLLNVLVWGTLYVLAVDEVIKGWDTMKGRTVLIPFRGGVPDLLFRYLAGETGPNLDKNLTFQYTTDFAEAVQLLLAGRGDAAVLAEPSGTAAQHLGQQKGLKVRRVLNLQEEWARVTGRRPRIPEAGTLALTSLVDNHSDVVQVIQSGLRASVDWATQNRKQAAELGAKYLGLKAPMVEKSLVYTPMEMVPAAQAREDLEFWFSRLKEKNPKIIGGALPDDKFYYGGT